MFMYNSVGTKVYLNVFSMQKPSLKTMIMFYKIIFWNVTGNNNIVHPGEKK